MEPLLMVAPTDLERLVATHHVGVWRYLRLVGCSREDADDLTQETFLVAMRTPFEDRNDAQTATWLRRTARNLFLHSRRRHTTRREVNLDAADAVMQRQNDDGDAYVEAMRRCLEGLQGRTREAVLGCYSGRPAEEVAAAMGLKPNGLKTLLQRARMALRDCVKRRTVRG